MRDHKLQMPEAAVLFLNYFVICKLGIIWEGFKRGFALEAAKKEDRGGGFYDRIS